MVEVFTGPLALPGFHADVKDASVCRTVLRFCGRPPDCGLAARCHGGSSGRTNWPGGVRQRNRRHCQRRL